MGRLHGIVPVLILLGVAAGAAGCGGGANVQPPPPQPDFSLTLSPSSLTLTQGTTSTAVNVTVAAQNGFTGLVQVTLSGLPTGVTSNPASPFSMNAGASQAVIFGADSSSATGNATAAAQGTSGNLSHSASLSVIVQPGTPPPALPRTAFARTDSVPSLDDPPGEPRRRRIVYDAARKHVFAANPGMNRLEVFSAADGSRAGQIAIPAVTSVDITADGSAIWAGTADEQIVTVDPAPLVVTARFPVSGLMPLPNTVFNRPVEVLALAGGKGIVRLRRPDAATSLLALWDPATNSFTNLTSLAPSVFKNGAGVMARSGDHAKVLVAANDSTGNVALFGAAGNLLAGPISIRTGSIALAAANADGSAFAIAFQGDNGEEVILLDAELNPLHAYGVALARGLAFSRDGSSLFVSENADLPPVVTALNAATLQVIGQVSDAGFPGVRSEIEESDETGMLFGIANRGVALVDASRPATLPPIAPTFGTPPAVAPAGGPSVGGTAALLAGQNFPSTAIVRFGSQLAASSSVLSGTQIQVTSPPNSEGGPANVTAFFPGGWIALAPSGFSYGPQILEVLPNAGNKSGSDVIQILGYGFGSDPANIGVTIGGARASVDKVEDVTSISASLGLGSNYPFPIERITLQTPPGSAGKADVVVASPGGSTKTIGGFQYLQDVRVHGKAGLFKFILYDQKRQFVYLSNTDHVDVFDLKAGQFQLNGLQPPQGRLQNAGLRGMALTPDSSQLVVADFGSQSVYLLSPNAPATGTTVFVGGVPGFLSSGPARVAATSTGKVFVGLAGEGQIGACTTCLGQLDIATQSIEVAPQPEVSSLTGAPLLSGTSSGNQVYLAFGAAPGGPVAVWDASSDHFTSSQGNAATSDIGAAADGTSFVVRQGSATEFRGADLSLAAVPTANELESLPGRVDVPGVSVHPSGSLVYRPFLLPASGAAPALSGVDISDAHTGALRLRVMLPEALQTDVDGLHGSFLTTDETGGRLFAITASGLTIVQLASVPLGIGSITPAQTPATGGTQITIRGSGFHSSTNVTIGGASATGKFVDSETLQATTPAMKPGPQRVVVTNADGEAYALDAAFTAD